jgi:hypothetical protein
MLAARRTHRFFMLRNGHRHLHKDFVLSCNPKKTVDGRFQASLAITYLGGERTRSQRFIDMTDVFDTEEEAAAHARTVGIEWIERQLGSR